MAGKRWWEDLIPAEIECGRASKEKQEVADRAAAILSAEWIPASIPKLAMKELGKEVKASVHDATSWWREDTKSSLAALLQQSHDHLTRAARDLHRKISDLPNAIPEAPKRSIYRNTKPPTHPLCKEAIEQVSDLVMEAIRLGQYLEQIQRGIRLEKLARVKKKADKHLADGWTANIQKGSDRKTFAKKVKADLLAKAKREGKPRPKYEAILRAVCAKTKKKFKMKKLPGRSTAADWIKK